MAGHPAITTPYHAQVARQMQAQLEWCRLHFWRTVAMAPQFRRAARCTPCPEGDSTRYKDNDCAAILFRTTGKGKAGPPSARWRRSVGKRAPANFVIFPLRLALASAWAEPGLCPDGVFQILPLRRAG